jgi:hypothetical protein
MVEIESNGENRIEWWKSNRMVEIESNGGDRMVVNGGIEWWKSNGGNRLVEIEW